MLVTPRLLLVLSYKVVLGVFRLIASIVLQLVAVLLVFRYNICELTAFDTDSCVRITAVPIGALSIPIICASVVHFWRQGQTGVEVAEQYAGLLYKYDGMHKAREAPPHWIAGCLCHPRCRTRQQREEAEKRASGVWLEYFCCPLCAVGWVLFAILLGADCKDKSSC